MTCSDVGMELTRAAGKTRSELSAEMRRHLDSCEHCRKVWEFLVGSSERDPPETEQHPEITRSITESLEPVTPVAGSRLLTLGFLLIFGLLSAAFVAWSGIRGTAAMGWAQFAGGTWNCRGGGVLIGLHAESGNGTGREAPLDAGTAVPGFVGPSVLDGVVSVPMGIGEQSGPPELALFHGGLYVFPARGRAGGARVTARSGSIARRRRRRSGLAGGFGGSRCSALRLRNSERASHRVVTLGRAPHWGGNWRSDGSGAATCSAMARELTLGAFSRVDLAPISSGDPTALIGGPQRIGKRSLVSPLTP